MFEIDWNWINWLGQTYGIWLHDYWPFYLTIACGIVWLEWRFLEIREMIKKAPPMAGEKK